MREVVYVSERITNIKELETIIKNARVQIILLKSELQKTALSMENINSTAEVIGELMKKAEGFEFHIEKRKCTFKGDFENPKL